MISYLRESPTIVIICMWTTWWLCLFLVSRLEVAANGGAGAVEIEDARGVHDEDRPAEKLVHANACRSCTSRLALQARWNKRVILV